MRARTCVGQWRVKLRNSSIDTDIDTDRQTDIQTYRAPPRSEPKILVINEIVSSRNIENVHRITRKVSSLQIGSHIHYITL